jgi:hypothetical protein
MRIEQIVGLIDAQIRQSNASDLEIRVGVALLEELTRAGHITLTPFGAGGFPGAPRMFLPAYKGLCFIYADPTMGDFGWEIPS